ncbi:hypothetical protein OOZ63_26385 [Paucibacter sp. PLA-PC-4]|uniref:LPD7 domain-containing protein n=1 Tax=Paucibacter sp. PLA-PC-4 TaxID=2993655 RepID=UPI00224B0044|nr:LPD7 domain-containing protein [Paucibacter sp. PLA-PC-4]MCX2865358.1 hypothetical protein [Paucibacter sp. PLA-PC-4]
MDKEHTNRPGAAAAPAHSSAAVAAAPAGAHGGTVEPAPRARADRDLNPAPPQGERYELRDPFNEVTYRARTFGEMTAKAAQLDASRFTAIDADGTRTPVRKIDGEWQRGDRLPALMKPAPDLRTTRDDFPDPSDAAADERTTGPAAKRAAGADKAGAKIQARIDAQAERAAMVARIESSLQEQYIIKRAPITLGDMAIGSTEYRFRGDSSRVAFTESHLRLSTDTNSPSVARSMVDLAQARGWTGLRVSGADDFRRMVWLEASIRGVKALGYEPNLGDMNLLRREREARQHNRIQPVPEAVGPSSPHAPAVVSDKPSARGGSRKAVIAAMDAILTEKKVPEAKRLAVLAAAERQLAEMARNGHVPKVRVYDRSAERQATVAAPAPDVSRTPDRQHDRAPAPPVR